MPKRRKPAPKPLDGPVRVALYLRVSTREQADSGAGLAAQESALRLAAAQRGWTVAAVCTDAGSTGKNMKRPGLAEALRLVESGEADVLAVAKLDRLSRSVADFAAIMARSVRNGWALVALDLGVDTTTSGGRLIANIMAALAEWEREVIGERTRDALAEKRAAGVTLGRPPAPLDAAVVQRILDERAQGRSLPVIANRLNDDEIPTARGGLRWYPSTVRDVLLRHAPERAA